MTATHMTAPPIEFDVRDETIPSCPRLIVRAYGTEVHDTGMLHDAMPQVAKAMIAAARRLHPFTDEEVAAIRPMRSIMERAMDAWQAGRPVPMPDGSTPANEAFRTPIQ